jgi:hypothetical protein
MTPLLTVSTVVVTTPTTVPSAESGLTFALGQPAGGDVVTQAVMVMPAVSVTKSTAAPPRASKQASRFTELEPVLQFPALLLKSAAQVGAANGLPPDRSVQLAGSWASAWAGR